MKVVTLRKKPLINSGGLTPNFLTLFTPREYAEDIICKTMLQVINLKFPEIFYIQAHLQGL